MKKSSKIILLYISIMVMALGLLLSYAFINGFEKTLSKSVTVIPPNNISFKTDGYLDLIFNVPYEQMDDKYIGNVVATSQSNFWVNLSNVEENICCHYKIKLLYNGNMMNFTGLNISLYNYNNADELYTSENVTLTNGMDPYVLYSDTLCIDKYNISKDYRVIGNIYNDGTVQDQLYTSGNQTINLVVDDIVCE